MKISKKERLRLEAMSLCEKRLRGENFWHVAGVDEAGRGPLAGPVVAAACILPEGALFANLNDSKQLSPDERNVLFKKITNFPGLYYGIGIVDIETIDQINILQATFLAMKKAVESLTIQPDYILIDGNQRPLFDIPVELLIGGDGLSVSIAAASIIAKVTRDQIMIDLDKYWPEYGFRQHKGYATEQHLQAIEKFGPCPVHRKSFDPIKSILYPPPIQMELLS